MSELGSERVKAFGVSAANSGGITLLAKVNLQNQFISKLPRLVEQQWKLSTICDSTHGRLKLARVAFSLIATSRLYLLSRKPLSSIVHLPLHRPNGANGMSDMAGKAAR